MAYTIQITLTGVNGIRTLETDEDGYIKDSCKNRRLLERNVLDIITCDERDFDDCEEAVEEASLNNLAKFLYEYENEKDYNKLDGIIYKYFEI